MKLSIYKPSDILRQYIRKYWMLEVEAEDCPLIYPVIPFGSFELVFNLDQSTVMQGTDSSNWNRQPHSFYSGHYTRTINLCFKNSAKIIGVSLQSWTGNSLFEIPADSFKDLSVNLELLKMDDLLLHGLIECEDERGVVTFLNRQLEKRLLNKPIDSLVSHITTLIINDSNPDSLRNYLNSLAYSRRRIEQRFREAAGLTMSSFIRKTRFQKAVHLIQNSSSHYLTAIGLEAGYYDQSHFIREFKTFSSQTPKSFIENRVSNKHISHLMMVE